MITVAWGVCRVYLISTSVFGRSFGGSFGLYSFLSFWFFGVCCAGFNRKFFPCSVRKNVQLYTDKIFVELTAYRVPGLAIVTNGPN